MSSTTPALLPPPAKDGPLGVRVGAADDDFAEAKPLPELYGDPEKIRHVGPVGAGNAPKSVVNLSLGIAMGGWPRRCGSGPTSVWTAWSC